MTDRDFSDHYVTARDGLRLLVCLPGLARTADDFDALAAALAKDRKRPRRVLALDYRGRGLSDHDPDPANYSIPVELDDALAVLTARAVDRAVFIGTSRGGLLVMALATVRPTVIAGAVLNDIGPVIEPQGLIRIKSYVGKLPQPRGFAEGADILRRLFGAQFTKLTDEDWLASARRTWRERDGRLVVTYDPKLSHALAAIDPNHPLPTLWPQFDALGQVPLMVIRGATSDILSAATVAAMGARRRAMTVLEISDQGHAPLLAESATIARIAEFIAQHEPAACACAVATA